MSRQWKRVCQLIIGEQGKGLLVEELRMTFEIIKTVTQEPNTALIKVYNLNPTNEAKIKDEFDEVLLNAGYEDSIKLIFRGNIKNAYRYRETTDIITEIEAADGDTDYKNSIMNETLASGTGSKQLIDRALVTMPRTSKGHVQIADKIRGRGKVISGNTRDVLRDLAKDSGANWSIQDGQFQMIGANSVLPGTAIVLRSDTGMLEVPEVNDKGVSVKCLLNPDLKINGVIKIDNNNVKGLYRRTQPLAPPRETKENQYKDPVRPDPDGLYKIIKLTHNGDTRGQEWVSIIEAIGLNEPIPDSR